MIEKAKSRKTAHFTLNQCDNGSNTGLIGQTAETFCRTFRDCTATEGMDYWIDPETGQKRMSLMMKLSGWIGIYRVWN